MPLALSSPAPQVSVTIGPVGPRTVAVAPAPAIESLAEGLEQAIATADPAPGFTAVRVVAAGGRLLLLPGPVGDEIAAYLRIDVDTDEPLDLDAASAYLLGNVAAASHGEDGRAGSRRRRRRLGELSAPRAGAAAVDVPAERRPPAASSRRSSLRVGGVLWQSVDGLYGQAGDRAGLYRAHRGRRHDRPWVRRRDATARRCRPAGATSSRPTGSGPAWPDACGPGP